MPEPVSNPEQVEALAVAASTALSRDMKAVGATVLLMKEMDWERLFSSASPPGAVTPDVAKSSLTRDSRRRWELARKARRGIRPEFLMLNAIRLSKP